MSLCLRSVFALAMLAILAACNPSIGRYEEQYSRVYSLTGDSFRGKKYYLGWGAAGGGDPTLMQNEVKYDVLHTHDVFTSQLGGNYSGTKMTSFRESTVSAIKQGWQNIKSQSTADDMYLQYSSTHGFGQGIAVGGGQLLYKDIANQVLDLPNREKVVLMMACYSGNLVDEFNRQKSKWQDYGSQGKSLFVMSSSPAGQESSTGPGNDNAQPGGEGSAGSAYGHAVWKALAGEADGYLDGLKDGYISIGEFVTYASDRTKKIGGHVPQFTGVFSPNTLLAKTGFTSSSSYRDGTDDSNDAEISREVVELDRELEKTSQQLNQQYKKAYGSYAPDIYVLIESAGSPDTVKVYTSAAAVTGMAVCAASPCGVNASNQSTVFRDLGERKIYVSANVLTVNPQAPQFVVAAVDSAGNVTEKKFQFAAPPANNSSGPSLNMVGGSLKVQDLTVNLPQNMGVLQEAKDGNTMMLVFAQGEEQLTLYVAPGNVNLATRVGTGKVTKPERAESRGGRNWRIMDTSRQLTTAAKGFSGSYFATSFATEQGGYSYYGQATSKTEQGAAALVDNFLNNTK